MSSDNKIIGKINNIINSNIDLSSPSISATVIYPRPLVGDIPGTILYQPDVQFNTPIGRVYNDSRAMFARQLVTPVPATTSLDVAVALGYFVYIDNSENTNEYLYVSNLNGDDTNNGSFEEPFKTITHALSVVVTGQIIIVFRGIYTESLTIAVPNIGIVAYTSVDGAPTVFVAGTLTITTPQFAMGGIQVQSVTINNTGTNYFENCFFIPTTTNTPSIIFSITATGNSTFNTCFTSTSTIQGQVQDLGTAATAIFNNLDAFIFTGATTTSTAVFAITLTATTNIVAHGSGQLSFLDCSNCSITASTATLAATNVLSYKNCSFIPLLNDTPNTLNKTGTARCWVDSSVVLPPVPTSATGIVYKDGNKGITNVTTVVLAGTLTVRNNVPAHYVYINNTLVILAINIVIDNTDGTGYVDNAEIVIMTRAGITAITTLTTTVAGATIITPNLSLLSAAGSTLKLRYNAQTNTFAPF